MASISQTIPTPGVPYANVRIVAENVHEFKALREEFLRAYPEYAGGDTDAAQRSVASEISVAEETYDDVKPEEPLTVQQIADELDASVDEVAALSDAKAAFLKKKKGA